MRKIEKWTDEHGRVWEQQNDYTQWTYFVEDRKRGRVARAVVLQQWSGGWAWEAGNDNGYEGSMYAAMNAAGKRGHRE